MIQLDPELILPMPKLTPAEADAIGRFERGAERPQTEAWYIRFRRRRPSVAAADRLYPAPIGKREARAEVWAAVSRGLAEGAEHVALSHTTR